MLRMEQNGAAPASARTQASAEKTSVPLKAVAHRDRLLILHLLNSGEMRVSDIAEATRLPQPVVSQHLGRLRRVDLVQRRRDSTSAFYSIDRTRVDQLLQSLSALFGVEAEERVASGGSEREPQSKKQSAGRDTAPRRTARLSRARPPKAA